MRRAQTKALKGARIVFDDGGTVIDCIIGHLSATGALLRAKSVAGVPPTFVLIAPDGNARLCRIVWKSTTELGVAFDSPLRG